MKDKEFGSALGEQQKQDSDSQITCELLRKKKKIVAIEKSGISLKACKLFIKELNHSIQSCVCLKLLYNRSK